MLNHNLLLADDGYNIQRSLRFRSSASANLTRTLSASDRKTWTWSGWVKRGSLTTQMGLIGSSDGTNNGSGVIFDSSGTLYVYDYVGASFTSQVKSSAVYRDPSAWYHFVVAYDTTQATASNRVKMYVNGSQITSFSASNYPTLNYASGFLNTSTYQTKIGIEGSYGNPFDGYLTEINFIDGQALTPSSFGETDPITGVWKPKKYAGTYGTNGFFLNFSDNSSNTATTIGKDYSGNGNNWTPNNISVTAGATYDSMTDVPTLTSPTASNFAVLNPIAGSSIANLTITNGNLQVTTPIASVSNFFKSACSIAVSSGKWYFEDTVTALDVNNWAISICGTPPVNDSSNQNGLLTGEISYFAKASSFETIYVNGSATYTGASAASANDVIGIAFDADNRTIQFYRNNSAISTAQTINSASVYYISLIVRNNTTASIHNVNFGQRPFSYTPPTGFVALNTFNLPEPSIKAGNKHFDVTTFSGVTGGTQTITNSGGFQPDFVWNKTRATVDSHYLVDSVRGIANYLSSNATASEASAPNFITSLNSNGISYGTSGYNAGQTSNVVWQWKAGGSAVSNTAGSITSQVSANTSAGFSVVTYTGTGANATVGHGLGVAPKMIIVKNRTQAAANIVGHSNMAASSPWNGFLQLHSTSAYVTSSGNLIWNNTAPTSAVFSIGTDTSTNFSGNNFVAYCFSEVSGYSKFGSYTGNGSADGTFVHLGFRPKFVMIKNSSGIGNWIVVDTSRNTNGVGARLYADLSDAEYSGDRYDQLSNGFKVRTTSAESNTSGATYIYMAFAENPFKYSLAR